MQTIPDWNLLWKDLAELRQSNKAEGDLWEKRASGFNQAVKERWKKPDSSRDTLLAALGKDSTLLDIGAGTGAWALLAGRKIRLVTALEPSESMRGLLVQNVREAGLQNIRILNGSWPDAQVEEHDFSLCAHAMYGAKDFAAFVRRMTEVTRKTCFMLIRAPLANGVMAEAARLVLGHPHDSPNLCIAYNALLQMGYYPDVHMEDESAWVAWVSDSLEAALQRIKERLGITGKTDYDSKLMDLIQKRLILVEGQYHWPPGTRSALLSWPAKSD